MNASRAFRIISACIIAWLSIDFTTVTVFAQQEKEEEKPVSGRVYVMANRAEGNTIVVLDRNPEGKLTQIQEVSTGGLGSGPGELPAPFPPFPAGNPLTSQDGLVITDDGRFLLAVNALSNDISVLKITEAGLRLVDKAPSNGNVPVSIAHYKNLVYVMNEGQFSPQLLGARPVLTGYFLDDDGRLHPIPNSTRITGSPDSEPGDVLFSPDGKWLIITDKFAETFIHVLHVDDDFTTHETGVYVANNPAPLGAAFTHHHILAVSEANARLIDGRRTGVPDGSTMSTYRFTRDGTLEPISVAVGTLQTVACWVRFTPDGRFAYTTNKGSGSISSFRVSEKGELTLLEPRAADTGGLFSEPIDEDITPDGKFLYMVSPQGALDHFVLPFPPNIGTVRGYRIGEDGSLTPVDVVAGFPISIAGIVAR